MYGRLRRLFVVDTHSSLSVRNLSTSLVYISPFSGLWYVFLVYVSLLTFSLLPFQFSPYLEFGIEFSKVMSRVLNGSRKFFLEGKTKFKPKSSESIKVCNEDLQSKIDRHVLLYPSGSMKQTNLRGSPSVTRFLKSFATSKTFHPLSSPLPSLPL